MLMNGEGSSMGGGILPEEAGMDALMAWVHVSGNKNGTVPLGSVSS